MTEEEKRLVRAEYGRKWRRENQDKVKANYEKRRDKINADHSIWCKKHRDKLCAKHRLMHERRKSDPVYQTVRKLRGMLSVMVKSKGKLNYFNEVTGCTGLTLRQHLELQFRDGMTWENYGGKTGWVLDHIVPIALFPDITKDWQQKSCFNYKNIQPLWRWENDLKGDKLEICPV